MILPESTTERGQRAERQAARFLEQRGYHILQQNYRCRGGEIDLVAEQGDVLCFVEVRSRRSAAFGDPLATVDGRKQARLIRAARYYLATHRGAATRPCRFDVVGIVYEPELALQLVQNAFEVSSTLMW